MIYLEAQNLSGFGVILDRLELELSLVEWHCWLDSRLFGFTSARIVIQFQLISVSVWKTLKSLIIMRRSHRQGFSSSLRADSSLAAKIQTAGTYPRHCWDNLALPKFSRAHSRLGSRETWLYAWKVKTILSRNWECDRLVPGSNPGGLTPCFLLSQLSLNSYVLWNIESNLKMIELEWRPYHHMRETWVVEVASSSLVPPSEIAR